MSYRRWNYVVCLWGRCLTGFWIHFYMALEITFKIKDIYQLFTKKFFISKVKHAMPVTLQNTSHWLFQKWFLKWQNLLKFVITFRNFPKHTMSSTILMLLSSTIVIFLSNFPFEVEKFKCDIYPQCLVNHLLRKLPQEHVSKGVLFFQNVLSL